MKTTLTKTFVTSLLFSLLTLILSNSVQAMETKTIRKGDMEAISEAIESNPYVVNVQINGLTPLAYALLQCQPKVVELLLENNADPNRYNEYDGSSAFHDAINYVDTKMVQLLLTGKADPNDSNNDHYDNFPLHRAARKGNLPIIQLLITNKADINKKNRMGDIAQDIVQLLQDLIEKNAFPPNVAKRSAKLSDCSKIIELLKTKATILDSDDY